MADRNDGSGAEASLAVIRKLMERGQTYEAVTRRGAFRAGIVALGLSGVLHVARTPSGLFLAAWTAVAGAVAAWLVLAALRPARAPGAGAGARARQVGLAVLPAYAVAAMLSARAMLAGDSLSLPATWTLLHGVAILSTGYHAPRRLVALGVAFLAVGGGLAFLPVERDLAMAIGFGGLNVAYGLWPSQGGGRA